MAMSMGSWAYPTKYLPWEATDNCKNATYPLKMYRYVPETFSSIESANLQFSIEKFRSYETTTASGGGSTSTSGSGGSIVPYTSNTFFDMPLTLTNYDEWYEYTGWSSISSSCVAFVLMMSVRVNNASGNTITARLKNKYTNTYFPSQNGSPMYLVDDKDASAVYIECGGTVFSSGVSLEIRNESRAGTTVRLSGTSKEKQAHTHSVTISAHTHDMDYDIYEASYSNPSISIKINDTDRTTALGGPWTSDQNAIDIADYLNIGEWNKIELVPNQLLRLNTSVLVVGIE